MISFCCCVLRSQHQPCHVIVDLLCVLRSPTATVMTSFCVLTAPEVTCSPISHAVVSLLITPFLLLCVVTQKVMAVSDMPIQYHYFASSVTQKPTCTQNESGNFQVIYHCDFHSSLQIPITAICPGHVW